MSNDNIYIGRAVANTLIINSDIFAQQHIENDTIFVKNNYLPEFKIVFNAFLTTQKKLSPSGPLKQFFRISLPAIKFHFITSFIAILSYVFVT